eukprot:XP_014035897.1 PREDICTED: non-structural maintenance of chromosomes element 4 homolog A-like [Salmo salar]
MGYKEQLSLHKASGGDETATPHQNGVSGVEEAAEGTRPLLPIRTVCLGVEEGAEGTRPLLPIRTVCLGVEEGAEGTRPLLPIRTECLGVEEAAVAAGGGGDDDDDEAGCSPADMQDEDNDPARRREIRSKYRDLINSVQQNREDMLSPTNNKLTDVLEEANKLFAEVRQAREAALDAHLLVLATDLGKEKASQLHAEGSAFDPSAFAEHLLSFMGLNRLEDEDEEEEGGASGGYLPQDSWQRVANRAQRCFRTAPSFHYMMGSFLAELPSPRQRVERQRKAPSKEVKRIMPTQVSALTLTPT